VKRELQDWADGPGKLGVSQHGSFVYTSPTGNSAALNKKEEVGLYQSWSDLGSNYPLVGTSISFAVVFRSHASTLD